MRSFYSLLLLTAAAFPVDAATLKIMSCENPDVSSSSEKTDSISSDSSTDLQEIVVQGRTQRVIKYGVEYIPDKATKRNSLNAFSLLDKMKIPQLYVDPFDMSVKTMNREEVSFFIDYMPAQGDMLSNLRPEDVLRVEVLDYPQDPRFNSASHVVNFIMQKYEWGGYTRLGFNTHFLADNDFSTDVFSRFVYKKMTFDANVSGGYNFLNRNPYSTVSTYRDLDFLGRHYDEIVRSSATDYVKNRLNAQSALLRAVWQTNTSYVQHQVSFNRVAQPVQNSAAHVSFSIPDLEDTRSATLSSNQSLTPSLSGYYWFQLPRQNYLVASWSFSYGASKKNSEYTVADLAPIINNTREKVYSPNATVTYSKVFPRNNTFRTSLMTYSSVYHTDYTGSNVQTQHILSNENMLFLEYFKNWASGLNLYSRVGVSYVVGRINGVNTLEEWNPRLGMQLNYRINDKHSASIDGWWGNSHPDPATASEALVQSNELLWLQGNPDLRNTLFASANAGYTFIPTNHFSLSATLSYEGNPHKQSYLYYTLPGMDGLIRKSINSGSANDYRLRVSATLRLLDNALTIQGSGLADRIVLTGIDKRSLNSFYGSVNAQYMRDNWSVSLYYQSPSRSLGAWSNGYLTKFRASYGASFSFTAGDFKTSLNFNNWFRHNYFSTVEFNSPYFSTSSQEWASNLSRIVYVSLAYTFSYGKKINHGGEASGGGGVGSAVLQ